MINKMFDMFKYFLKKVKFSLSSDMHNILEGYSVISTKEKIKGWILILLSSILISTLINVTMIPVNDARLYEKIELDIVSVEKIEGYDVEKDLFTEMNSDIGLIIKNEEKINVIKLEIEHVINSDIDVQVYYKENKENFEEENRKSEILKKDQNVVAVDIPEGTYDEVKVVINVKEGEQFRLRGIEKGYVEFTNGDIVGATVTVGAFFVILLSVFILLVMVRFVFPKIELNKSFVVIALLLGLPIVFLNPKIEAQDENTHYLNSYSIASGDLWSDERDGERGKYIPENIMHFSGHPHEIDSERGEAFWGKTYWSTNLTTINPIGYVFSSAGMLMVILFNKIIPVLEGVEYAYTLLVAGRCMNLFAYITIVACALKITPILRKTMMLLALMPMCVYLAASITYEGLLISSCMLLFAVMMKLLSVGEEYRISKRDILYVAFCTIAIVGVKYIYAVLLLPLFAIPVKRYGNKKRYFKTISIVIGCALVAYLPNIIEGMMSVEVFNYLAINEAIQRNYLLENYMSFPGIIHNANETFRYYNISFFGVYTHTGQSLTSLYRYTFLCVLFLMAVVEVSSEKRLNFRYKILGLISTSVVYIGIYLAMFLYFTATFIEDGKVELLIQGVQGRYFIPLVLFFVSLFSNSILAKNKEKTRIEQVLVGIGYIVCITCLIGVNVDLYYY